MAIIELSKSELSDISGGNSDSSLYNYYTSIKSTVQQWFSGIKNALLGRTASSQEGQLACSYTAEKK